MNQGTLLRGVALLGVIWAIVWGVTSWSGDRKATPEKVTGIINAAEFEDTVFGITARELTTDVKIALNLADDVEGVIILRIKSGSDASLARLRRNYVIQRMGDIPVRTLEDFRNAIETLSKEKPQEIPVFCRVGPNTAFFRIKPRWAE